MFSFLCIVVIIVTRLNACKVIDETIGTLHCFCSRNECKFEMGLTKSLCNFYGFAILQVWEVIMLKKRLRKVGLSLFGKKTKNVLIDTLTY